MKQFHSNGSGVPPRIQVEHIRRWLVESWYEKTPDATNWLNIVNLVHTEFCNSWIAEEVVWKALLLIPKGGKCFGRMVLMEVLRKKCAVILYHRLCIAITFHDIIHGLQAGRRTGTSSPEVKILQQLASMMKEVLYEIFMDLHKAYDSMYRYRFRDLLEVYGSGPQALRMIWKYWELLTMVAWEGGYHIAPFKCYQVVTQGYPLS